ncbi:uncharacterized protein VICG_00089 [Vittaforma corneae ATCC 50505]|uniref:J domain-containing protein n=1 Tax=Vittaforma corneae (strain ATCC 50505) TaxID=993615 RepID=L2GQ84_VITCO|nr:uncharacterized protein VICG_00089 [Vittaforma corneae ATCC 50505]ELA42774.1 hypothetical protein VICG_00089 [Vittaforma corneae ATCC 50505]
MPTDFKTKARECLENADYRGYAEFSEKQYNQTQEKEDLEELEKSKKLLQLSREIHEILKMEGHDCYKILGLDQNASLDEIKKTFREKAARYHPNRAPVKGAEDAFRIIQGAYFEINTEDKREQYDGRRKGSRFFFSGQPVYSQAYYATPISNSMSYSFGNRQFMFSTGISPGFWPYRFTEGDFINFYSQLYRNAYRPYGDRQTERQTLYFSIFIMFILILLNFFN